MTAQDVPLEPAATGSAAFAEPTARVGARYVVPLALAGLGIMMAFFGPIQNLLPRLAERSAMAGPGGLSKEAVLGLVTAVGAFVSVVANPLAGALSDRTSSRLGRRRPWVLGGLLVGAASLVALGPLTSAIGLVAAWAFVQASVNASYSAVTASIPDQVPVGQRGVVSGWVGVTQSLGVVLGVGVLVLVGKQDTDLVPGAVVTAALLALLVLPFVLLLRDQVLPSPLRPPFALGPFLRSFWVSPREHPDFARAWVTRFLVSLGNAMVTGYLLFFLKDRVQAKDPDTSQVLLIAVYTLGILLTAVLFGRISDRSGRRRVYVVGGTLVMAVAGLILAFATTVPLAVVAAGVMGLGYGCYLAVDQALITQVLPAAGDRAKDLGVINIANAMPQVFGNLLASVIVIVFGARTLGYPVLFLAATLVTVASIPIVQQIRSVP